VGVLVGIGIAVIVKVTWGRANTGARIGGILASLLTLWVMIGLVDPHAAAVVAAGIASGFGQLIRGLGGFLGQLR
jgi:Co/Zn/Cd efflux system component